MKIVLVIACVVFTLAMGASQEKTDAELLALKQHIATLEQQIEWLVREIKKVDEIEDKREIALKKEKELLDQYYKKHENKALKNEQ